MFARRAQRIRPRIAAAAAMAAAFLLVAAPAAGDELDLEQIPADELTQAEQTIEAAVAAWVNAVRIDEGLEPLALWPHNDHARAASQDRADGGEAHALMPMLRDRYRAEHPVRVHEVQHASVRTPSPRAFMDSPAHWAILTDVDATHMAVGVTCGVTDGGTHHTGLTLSVHLIVSHTDVNDLGIPAAAEDTSAYDERAACPGELWVPSDDRPAPTLPAQLRPLLWAGGVLLAGSLIFSEMRLRRRRAQRASAAQPVVGEDDSGR